MQIFADALVGNGRRDLFRAFEDRALRVGVLMGGFSSEREISLRSGAEVANGLSTAGFAVEAVDVKSRRIPALASGRFDVFFIALHGKFGEDGELQAILEKKRIPFTGSGSLASRRAMDKFESKRLFLRSNVPTATCWFYEGESMEWSKAAPPVYAGVRERLPGTPRCGPLAHARGSDSAGNRAGSRWRSDSLLFPLVVKPRAEGSSVGVSIVDRLEQLPTALTEAMKYGDDVLLEEFVAGRELTVGILGETALPIIELRPKRKFFDFAAKYQDPQTEYIINPQLDAGTARLAQRIAVKAHCALGCKGFSRVDLILRDGESKKSPRFVVLEVNSIPGMTERSLVPKAARAAGIEFPELCCRIVRLGVSQTSGRRSR